VRRTLVVSGGSFSSPAVSERRMPVSQNSRMIASSRKLTKVRWRQVASTALMCTIGTIGTGASGTVGGLSLPKGEYRHRWDAGTAQDPLLSSGGIAHPRSAPISLPESDTGGGAAGSAITIRWSNLLKLGGAEGI
jgi:hypothetical protein